MGRWAQELPPEMIGLLERNGIDPARVTELMFRWEEGELPTMEVRLHPVADEVRITFTTEDVKE